MKRPVPPACVLSDHPVKRLLGVVSPSKWWLHASAGREEVLAYLKATREFRISLRIMSRDEWRAYYREKRLEGRENHV